MTADQQVPPKAEEEKARPNPPAHDTSPAIISDHPFEPRGEWYTLCKHCSLAMAAHAETTVDPRDHIGYGDDHSDDL